MMKRSCAPRWPGRGEACLALLLCSAAALGQNRGEKLFQTYCAPCHGPKGDGGRGANLAVPKLSYASDDQALANIIRNGISGTEMPGTRINDAEVGEVVAFVRKLGRSAPSKEAARASAARGERLYRTKGKCADCHTLGGEGGALGPDLAGIGARRSPGYLRTALLNPEADVPDNFAQYRWVIFIPDNFLQVRVVTKDGRRITGARLNEDPFSIQLRDRSGRVYSFWKDELAELHKDWGKSPMPSYRDVFTPGELEDLVAYLCSLRDNP